MPWARFDQNPTISGSTGVFEIADAEYRTRYIGVATARDLFGLRGCITGCSGVFYRYEVTTAYLSRYAELLGRYHEQHGALPPENGPVGSLPKFGSDIR
jgi:hypothetical protein